MRSKFWISWSTGWAIIGGVQAARCFADGNVGSGVVVSILAVCSAACAAAWFVFIPDKPRPPRLSA